MEPAVFDCMVFLQAASRPGRIHGLFDAVTKGHLQLYVSPEIVAEIHDVLNRPSLRQQFPALTANAVDTFLEHLLTLAVMVSEVPHRYSLPRDPKDEKYIDLAIEVGAHFLASADKDLLSLMDLATEEGRAFHDQFPLLKIVKPGTLLREIELREKPQGSN